MRLRVYFVEFFFFILQDRLVMVDAGLCDEKSLKDVRKCKGVCTTCVSKTVRQLISFFQITDVISSSLVGDEFFAPCYTADAFTLGCCDK